KSIQYEELSGRENQYGLYVADRWQVNEKLTLNLGLRYEYYPLMQRENRGIETLDVATFMVRLGGLGGNPEDLGIKVSNTLFAPRVGAAYRINDNTVFRAGYGRTFDPLPWTRPMRGRFPLTIAYRDAGINGFIPYGDIAKGIGPAPSPNLESGTVPLPRGVDMTTPSLDNSERGSIHSYNAFIERRLPLDVSVSVGYAGTATVDGYATRNLNYAESGGNGNRQLFAQANTASINLYSSSAKARYNSLQLAVNRPFKNGFMLKGAYTLSKAMNEVEDDGGGYTWPQPSQFSRNYALANSDRTHMLQMGFVYALPFGRNSSNPLALVIKDWQVNGIASWLSGRPFTIGGDNGLLQQQGGTQTINLTGEAEAGFGEAGPNERWYDPSIFSQPGNAWGNTGRNQFRGPLTWNLDASLFRTINFGHYHLELRVESQNVLNHPQWANPVTGFTDPNFMRIRSYAGGGQGSWREPRRVQLGVRFVF
ncbi:MAG TPA: TonB-dependent receptor, partial [Vicinamibacterales bacterium]|nr:TonB-dependent receptor [Vicinamibacterales bacterium]